MTLKWRWRQNGRIPQGARFRDGRVLFDEDQLRAIEQYANRLEPLPNHDINQGWLYERVEAERTIGSSRRKHP